MIELTCALCGSEDLERDTDAGDGQGIPLRCTACGHRWRRQPKVSCRRCGSGDVEDVAIDSWAFEDLEEARENPQTTAWSYVDKTLFRCRKCRFEWQVGGQNRPYEASGRTDQAPASGEVAVAAATITSPPASRLSEALLGFTGPASLADEEALRAVPDATGVHVVWDSAGRLLFAGQSAQTRSRLRMHLSGDREASILHEKIGRRLDRELGRQADRDEIRDWLQRCTFAYRLTESPSALKAQIMDELQPELNEVRPRD